MHKISLKPVPIRNWFLFFFSKHRFSLYTTGYIVLNSLNLIVIIRNTTFTGAE